MRCVSVARAPLHVIGESRGIIVALIALLSTTIAYAQSQSVSIGHAREVIQSGHARTIGKLPPGQLMSLDLVLPLRDEAGLDNLLEEIHNPASASYRQFLTVEEFTAKFGPTQADYEAVVEFAKTHAFKVTGGSRDGMDVQVTASVSAVEAAFHVSMRTYQHPVENRAFYAPDRDATVNVPVKISHVSGLDNYSIPHPAFVARSDYAAAHGVVAEAVVANATTGSGPAGSFLGSDMRAAYYGGAALTGAGQHLGLLEFYGTNLADLRKYFAEAGEINSVPITLLSTDGSKTTCLKSAACDDTEQTLDMTQVIGMAPGLASLVMYVGRTDTAILSAMTTHHPLATTISCSWNWWGDPIALNPYFKRMAAQGQTFFAASGDTGTWAPWNDDPWPADGAFVVSVGGTELRTSGAGGAWASEKAWVDSGGGVSQNEIAIPAWQKTQGVITAANGGSKALRNGPDVAANAAQSFYTCANQTACRANAYGGTSFAAPMWAAFVALVNQQRAERGSPPIGFINPNIYATNVTSRYAIGFHDIQRGKAGTTAAVKGYDLVTGWGTPKGQLINVLAP
jgi:subtilase family serine protease